MKKVLIVLFFLICLKLNGQTLNPQTFIQPTYFSLYVITPPTPTQQINIVPTYTLPNYFNPYQMFYYPTTNVLNIYAPTTVTNINVTTILIKENEKD